MESTTIEISVENWQWLNSLKRPGESFNDVLNRLREQPDSQLATEDDPAEEIEPVDVPDDLDIPGSGDTYERRLEAIAQLYAYLREEGKATKSDFLEIVDPDRVNYSSSESFWSNAVKGRDSLSALPGVEPPSEGGRTWRYIES